MAGEADVTNLALALRAIECFDHAAAREVLVGVRVVDALVNLPEIEVIGPQALQRLVQLTHRDGRVAPVRADLRHGAAGRKVARAVRHRDGLGLVLGERQPEGAEDPAETLAPRFVHFDAPGQHLDVHLLEILRVMALEGVEGHRRHEVLVDAAEGRAG